MLLARSLNYRSVRELTETMDSAEYCLWAAEYSENPWGEGRKDLRAGIIASSIANWAGKSRKEGAPPMSPIDCMPFSQPDPQEASDSAEDIAAIIKNFS